MNQIYNYDSKNSETHLVQESNQNYKLNSDKNKNYKVKPLKQSQQLKDKKYEKLS